MLEKNIAQLLNEQVNKELYSAYLYLDFANYYADEGLDGFAHWYEIQAQEERDHAMLMRTYLMNNGEKVTLLPIDAPAENYASFDAPLKKTMEHEKTVTESIHTIFAAANEIHDYRAMEFLNWFIKEQAEEEKNAGDLIKKYQLFGTDAKGLYQLDQELKARVYSAPSLILD